jgi:hypothetical protein
VGCCSAQEEEPGCVGRGVGVWYVGSCSAQEEEPGCVGRGVGVWYVGSRSAQEDEPGCVGTGGGGRYIGRVVCVEGRGGRGAPRPLTTSEEEPLQVKAPTILLHKSSIRENAVICSSLVS